MRTNGPRAVPARRATAPLAALAIALVAAFCSPASAKVVDRVDPVSVSGFGGTGVWLRPIGRPTTDGRFPMSQLVLLPANGSAYDTKQRAPRVVPVGVPAFADRVVLGNTDSYRGTIVDIHAPSGWYRATVPYQETAVRPTLIPGAAPWSAAGEWERRTTYATPAGDGRSTIFDARGNTHTAPFRTTGVVSSFGLFATGTRSVSGRREEALWRLRGARFRRLVTARTRHRVRTGLGPVTLTNGVAGPKDTSDTIASGRVANVSRWIVSRGVASTSITSIGDFTGKVVHTTIPRRYTRGGVQAIALDRRSALLSAARPERCTTTAGRPECAGVRLITIPDPGL